VATPTPTVYCSECSRNVDVTREEFFAMERAERLVKRHGSGTWDRPAEWATSACNGCLTKSELPESVAFQMSRIRRHADEIRSRGVTVDEAISHAVDAQMIRADIKHSLPFAAWITNHEDVISTPTPDA
jgi:hypothetical protein